MRFQIVSIVLWPRSTERSPRVLPFALGSVNVISGASKTGKSAIIPIIDYCLGSDRCAIPVETIRNACSWFGAVVQTDGGQILFARREPGEQKSTGDMFTIEADSIVIPKEAPTKNTTVDAVKARLDELCGLTRLETDPESDSGFRGRPSFRDLMAFTFQPQNIVANPDVLFFKADTYEHREKLKAIFPYVLKAVTAETLAALQELERVNRTLQRKERELEGLRQVSVRWDAELRSLVVRARELGVIASPIPATATRGEMLSLLTTAATAIDPEPPSLAGVEEAMAELASLQSEESEIDSTLRGLRRRFAEMTKLRDSAAHLRNALQVQRDRVALADWLEKMDPHDHCPLCDSAISTQPAPLAELLQSLRTLEGEIKRVGAAPAAFDRELVRVKQDIEQQLEMLRGVEIRKNAVERRSDAARESSFRTRATARFLGGVERVLEIQTSIGSDGELTGEIEELKRRRRELSRVAQKPGIESRKKRALDRVSQFAGRLLPGLDSERPDDPVELSITDLTIRIKGASREDYLFEVGSGANWLAYHVSVSLALQQLFLADQPNPVPGFLVYDQPSQVYFPRRLAGSTVNDEHDPRLQDEDIAAVQKVFHVIARVVAASNHMLQVIILDHAGSDVWGDIPQANLVEEWRDGRKLVPMEWLQ
jgi:Protein of unknown function (DUF3732)